MQTSFTVLLPGAGIGKRMQSSLPKQYLKIKEKSIAEHTVNNLMSHPNVGKVVVALAKNDNHWKPIQGVKTCIGGTERLDTVLALLKEAKKNNAKDDDWVLIHDLVRPCVDHKDLDNLFDYLNNINNNKNKNDGAILGFQAIDSLKHINQSGLICADIDRDTVMHAATPQAFRLGALKEAIVAIQKINISANDEAGVMLYAGGKVKVIASSVQNIKLTTPSQLSIINLLLSSREGL